MEKLEKLKGKLTCSITTTELTEGNFLMLLAK